MRRVPRVGEIPSTRWTAAVLVNQQQLRTQKRDSQPGPSFPLLHFLFCPLLRPNENGEKIFFTQQTGSREAECEADQPETMTGRDGSSRIPYQDATFSLKRATRRKERWTKTPPHLSSHTIQKNARYKIECSSQKRIPRKRPRLIHQGTPVQSALRLKINRKKNLSVQFPPTAHRPQFSRAVSAGCGKKRQKEISGSTATRLLMVQLPSCR